MEMEGKWWVLYEEEPVDIEHSRVYDLSDGQVRDGRNGELLGAYEVSEDQTIITLHDRPGDNTVMKIRAGSATETSDSFMVDWTTSGFELYRENWPIPENETEDEEFDRLDWEDENFWCVTYGSALRDSPEIQKMHNQNVADLAATVH